MTVRFRPLTVVHLRPTYQLPPPMRSYLPHLPKSSVAAATTVRQLELEETLFTGFTTSNCDLSITAYTGNDPTVRYIVNLHDSSTRENRCMSMSMMIVPLWFAADTNTFLFLLPQEYLEACSDSSSDEPLVPKSKHDKKKPLKQKLKKARQVMGMIDEAMEGLASIMEKFESRQKVHQKTSPGPTVRPLAIVFHITGSEQSGTGCADTRFFVDRNSTDSNVLKARQRLHNCIFAVLEKVAMIASKSILKIDASFDWGKNERTEERNPNASFVDRDSVEAGCNLSSGKFASADAERSQKVFRSEFAQKVRKCNT
ncbi:hypothetical protein CLF_113076 [Clonorchis sinensis]|uniref:Uncharacterized protein n=1 Tax=Clonorchis sinensis TaxID=79923 RepID=G7YXK6_CLOSI|nr:hypothetical protein CLF_113076 [Clonorchis sinensis]